MPINKKVKKEFDKKRKLVEADFRKAMDDIRPFTENKKKKFISTAGQWKKSSQSGFKSY